MPAALGFGPTYASTSFFFIRQFGQVKKDIKDHLVNDSSESSFTDDGIKLARRDSEIVSLLSSYIAPWL